MTNEKAPHGNRVVGSKTKVISAQEVEEIEGRRWWRPMRQGQVRRGMTWCHLKVPGGHGTPRKHPSDPDFMRRTK
jgi:hypothetical protein